MKKLLFLVIAVAGFGFIKAMTEADAMSALEIFGEKCDPKPNEDDYKNIVRNTETVSMSTKCFRHCLMTQLDMLIDEKLDPEKLKELTSMLFEDKEAETVAIANTCNTKVTSADKCEAAHGYAMCILSEFKSKGWDLPELDKDEKGGS